MRGQLKLQVTRFDGLCVRIESSYVLYNYTHEPLLRHCRPDRKSYPPYPGPAIELPLTPEDLGLRILAYTCVYLRIPRDHFSLREDLRGDLDNA